MENCLIHSEAGSEHCIQKAPRTKGRDLSLLMLMRREVLLHVLEEERMPLP